MIKIENVNFKYLALELYNNLNLRILKGEHIVLIGPNGSGKTTFLKLLSKELTPDSGSIIYEEEIKVGYLDQYMKLDTNMIVKDYLYDVFSELFLKEEKMNDYYLKISDTNLSEKEVNNYLNYASQIQEELIEKDFYRIKSDVSNIVNGLGLSMDVLEMKIKHLSSGMRSKIILAKLLLEDNDLILLDEPTNFLDINHIEWLAKFLKEYQQAFVVVTHNEEFSSEIAEVILELSNFQIEKYKGNYQFYLRESEIRKAHYDKEFEAQSRFIKQTTEFIEKNITRASTSKRAKSRRKQLAKINVMPKRILDRTYSFDFPVKLKTGKDVLILKALEIGYSEPLLEPLDTIIRNGQKVVITGINGVGKSTLIKTVLSQIPKLGGEFIWDRNTKINYLAQDDFYLETLTAFEVTKNIYESFDRKEVYSLLASLGITFEMANRSINTLSGGEQMKIKLALMRENYGNVLILDEPTNHLDKAARAALKEALFDYKGTLILVSHDKEFYEGICDFELTLFN